MLADYLLKEARSRMYEKFDSLSPENQQRLINSPGMLRSEDQVVKGVARGNRALINKNNIAVESFPPIWAQERPHGNEPRSTVYRPDLTDKDLREFHSANLANGLGRTKPLTDKELDAWDAWANRHELHEAASTSKNPKNISIAGQTYVEGSRTGNHHSLGVLARDRQAQTGFSYLPSVKVQQQIRDMSGEAAVMNALGQQPFHKATFSKKDVAFFDKALPWDHPHLAAFSDKARTEFRGWQGHPSAPTPTPNAGLSKVVESKGEMLAKKFKHLLR